MRILNIANYLPYPVVSGGRLRVYNILRRLADRHEVCLAALLESQEDVEGVSHLRQFCARVETANLDRRSRLAKAPGMIRYALEGKPPDLRLLHSEELVEKIGNLFSTFDFDIVQIESVMGLYLATLPQTKKYKSVLMFHNCASQQFGRMWQVEQGWGNKLRAWINGVSMGYWEPRYAENFERCTTVSDLDKQLYLKANPRLQIDVIPNGVDTDKYQLLPPPHEGASPSLMFIGSMAYPPCVDAVLHFARDTLPLIRQTVDATEFYIVGANPHPEVINLSGSRIHVTGRVADVIPYYQQSTVCIVPLRAGGGTRLKILEAMALGRPVVSTTIGAEGLDVIDGTHLFIADTPEAFAEKTIRLLCDRQLYQYISANARRLVEARYSWAKIAERLMEVYEEVIGTPTVKGTRR
jgi:sugar transferase (PEP-CTERM/EpsH1 system associated)